MKIYVFWDVTPYSLVDTKVSGELSASIFRMDRLIQQDHPKRLSVSTSLYDIMSPKAVTFFIMAKGTSDIISIDGHLFETQICGCRSNPTADITMTTAVFRFVCLTSYHIQKCTSNSVTCFVEKK